MDIEMVRGVRLRVAERMSARVSNLVTALATGARRAGFGAHGAAANLGSALAAPAPRVSMAAGAEENGLAIMLGDLLRQNLEAKPKKMADFTTLEGHVAIVAEDADVALTLVFVPGAASEGGGVTIHDGIVGIPAMTIRGPSEAILALSNMPLATPLGLPLPSPGDLEAKRTVRGLTQALREGKLHFYGMLFHFSLAMKLTRVMSVNG